MLSGAARFLKRPARPAFRWLALAATSGAGAALGQAPWSLWWLALPALCLCTGLVAASNGPSAKIWTGWAAGAGYFATALFWIVEPFMIEPDRYGWMAPFALVFMAVGMALFWALAGGIATLGRGPAASALGFAIGLTAAELLRGYVLTGFPWALTGHIWIGTPVAQAAAWIGPVGLSALANFAAAAPHFGRTGRARAVWIVVAVFALGMVWHSGTLRLAAAVPDRAVPIRVRLIQPNAAQHLKWDATMWRVFLNRQMKQTAGPAEHPLSLIVWPETAVPFLLENAAPFLREMSVASGGVPIATGIQRSDGVRFFNSLAVIDGVGNLTATYDKWHLVPFGEYVPLGDLAAKFGVNAFAAQEGAGYSAGPGARLLDLGPAGLVLPLICYEAVFPQDLRTPQGRADWILQITNDGWFGTIAGPYQHLAQASLRAIEQGLPLLRDANTGITAVIDAHGRIVRSLALDTEGVIDVDVPPALARTFYSRSGDIPALAFVIVALLGLFGSHRRLRH